MYYNDSITACEGKTLESLTTSLNTESKILIDNSLRYLGGSSTYDGLYADDYYDMERNNLGYGSNPTRWDGKVGIMYPSDYAYATDLSVCKKNDYNYDANCKGKDWLYIGDDSQWLITTRVNDNYHIWHLSNGVIFGNYYSAGTDRVLVRPVVALKSNVKVTGGDGTSGNPYKLALSE